MVQASGRGRRGKQWCNVFQGGRSGQRPLGMTHPQPGQHRVAQLPALAAGRPPAPGWAERAEDLPLAVGQVVQCGRPEQRHSTLLEGSREDRALQPTACSATSGRSGLPQPPGGTVLRKAQARRSHQNATGRRPTQAPSPSSR